MVGVVAGDRARSLRGAIVLFAALFAACGRGAPERLTVETGEFGAVAIHVPVLPAAGLAFVFSAARGAERVEYRAAARLVEQGWVVALVDSRAALIRLARPRTECVSLVGPLEWISRRVQDELRFAAYREPVLLGRGEGAALARAVLAQAPPLAFAGGVGVDPVAAPGLAALCAADGRDASLPSWSERSAVELADAYAGGLESLASPAARAAGGSLADLPLVELRPAHPGDVLAVIYTGDGGWRDLDRTIGEWLRERGVSVVGVDALRYFWSARSPDETARDLARIVAHYRAAWSAPRVALIGYSFGAGILPFAYNRLPASEREAVELLVLLAPGRAADFEIHLDGWLGAALSDRALPLLPEIARIDAQRIQCVFGEEDAAESLCTLPALAAAQKIRTAGRHHFDGRYAELAQHIHARLAQPWNGSQ